MAKLEQADILEGDRVARRAGIQDEILGPALALEELDDLILLGMRGHAER